jgi:hypothetical protein
VDKKSRSLLKSIFVIVLVVIGGYFLAWTSTFLIVPLYSGDPIAAWLWSNMALLFSNIGITAHAPILYCFR